MAQVYFDTLKFVETLEEAGLPANQARAISSAVKDSHEAADVATKRDIDDVRKDMQIMHSELKTDIANVRTELKADIDDIRKDMEIMRTELKTDIEDVRKDMQNKFEKVDAKIERQTLQLTVRFGGILVVAVGVLAAIIKFPI